MEFYSQFGQDKYLFDNFFHSKKSGYFVDIGAYDGITQGSNSLFFEKIGWKGVCIEPNPQLFEKLKKNRECVCYNCAIADFKGECEFLYIKNGPDTLGGLTNNMTIDNITKIVKEFSLSNNDYDYIMVKTDLFDNLIEETTIDYLSLDTEGNELSILNTIDFKKYNIEVMTIENNKFDNSIIDFFINKPYKFLGRLGCDEVYIKIK
jgi:FkbM family methyltransferase